jgi:hypothetical protein
MVAWLVVLDIVLVVLVWWGVGFPYPCPAWRRAKTLFGLGLTLLDFVLFVLWLTGVAKGENLVLTCLCFA